jgi:hypothetical protein
MVLLAVKCLVHACFFILVVLMELLNLSLIVVVKHNFSIFNGTINLVTLIMENYCTTLFL